MKKICIIAAMLFAGPAVFAQQEAKTEVQPIETLINGPIQRSSGYGAVVVKVSSFNKKLALFSGAYGGWFVNDKFLVGLGGYGLSNRIRAPKSTHYPGENVSWNMGYGGLVLEYTLHSKKLIHYSFGTLLGGGLVGKANSWDDHNDFSNTDFDTSGFFVVEPHANVELNVTRWCRISAGASYRYISGARTDGIKDANLRAPSASLGVKFGGF